MTELINITEAPMAARSAWSIFWDVNFSKRLEQLEPWNVWNRLFL